MGRPFLIVCGGLVEALGREGQATIATACGVSTSTVARWRQALREPAIRRKMRAAYGRTNRPAAVSAANKGRVLGPRSPKVRANLAEVHRQRWERRHAVGLGWQPAWDALLGTMSDRKLAAQVGMTGQTVPNRRRALGIAAQGPCRNREARVWTAADDAFLGTMPDSALAAQLGCSLKVVFDRRVKLGVPGYRKYRKGTARE